MEVPATCRDKPVGIRFICEECSQETLLAIPPTAGRLGMVDCPSCGTTHLVMLGHSGAPELG